jgi:hypothetical protein
VKEGRLEEKSVYAYLSRISTLQQSACSPNLARSDNHSFPTLREFLVGKRFESDEEVKDAVKACLHVLATQVHCEGIQNLITGYDK